MNFELLEVLAIVHELKPKKYYRQGIKFSIPDIGDIYLRWNQAYAEIEYKPNDFETWSANLRFLHLLNIDLNQAIIVAIHFNLDFSGVSPEQFRQELAFSRIRKLFVVREIIHMKDGIISERVYDWSHRNDTGHGWSSPTVNGGNLPFKQISTYDYYRRHKVGINPTTRLEARYNSRSSLTRTVRLNELGDYLLEIKPFKAVRLFKEVKKLPKHGQERIKFELFRRLRKESTHSGAIQRLREFTDKPRLRFASVLDLYQPKRIDLNTLYLKQSKAFLAAKPPKKISKFLDRFERQAIGVRK